MSAYQTLVVLQPTSFCNIDCRYCYLPDRLNKRRMPIEVIRRVATEVLSSELLEEPFVFLWHLGEPLAVPPSFYTEAFTEIARINEVHRREYVLSFQTNATLLDSQWIKLIKQFRVRLGISLDGPAFIHDRQRVTRSGRGTHAAVLQGIKLLQSAGIPFSVITVLTDFSLDYPDEFFEFFRENSIHDVGFNIDEVEGVHTTTSFSQHYSIKRYREFLSRLIYLAEHHRGIIKFREVWTNLRTLALGGTDPYNTMNQPLRILNFDAAGNFSTFCPELVAAKSSHYGDFIMGNILSDNLADIVTNPVFQLVNQEIKEGLAACKSSCSYWNFCGGGAPSNKFFEHGRFNVAETKSCQVIKQATIDVLVDYLETKLSSGQQAAEILTQGVERFE
jgi:uncharacterized protein